MCIRDRSATPEHVQKTGLSFYEIKLGKGQTVIFTASELKNTELKIEPNPVSEANRNLFGLSERTERLPGHNFYDKR